MWIHYVVSCWIAEWSFWKVSTGFFSRCRHTMATSATLLLSLGALHLDGPMTSEKVCNYMEENHVQSVQNWFPQKLQPEVAKMSVGVVTDTILPQLARASDQNGIDSAVAGCNAVRIPHWVVTCRARFAVSIPIFHILFAKFQETLWNVDRPWWWQLPRYCPLSP
jgi:hypothetical protein